MQVLYTRENSVFGRRFVRKIQPYSGYEIFLLYQICMSSLENFDNNEVGSKYIQFYFTLI